MRRSFIVGLIIVLILFVRSLLPDVACVLSSIETTMSLGFLLLLGFMAGTLCQRVRLPKLTGYILAGVILGPYALGFIQRQTAAELNFINDLALTFIALAAGGELKLTELRSRSRGIIFIIIGSIIIVYLGVTLFMLLAAPRFLTGIDNYSFWQIAAIASMAGILSIARSPSSTIAVISECRAQGPFTETVLGVTVAIDVLVIMFFAVGLSVTEAVISPGTPINIGFLAALGGEIFLTILIGVIIGGGLSYYIYKVNADLAIVILLMAFLVAKLSQALDQWLLLNFDFSLHLEPLLICMAAGFTVQNFSEHGDELIAAIERVSLPVFVVFFTLVGINLNLIALEETWLAAILFVAVRAASIYGGSYLGGRLGGDPAQFNRLTGLGFITQAGVSLGLATEIVRRFPTWGAELATVIIAAIAVNQLIGPITLKYSLEKIGEVGAARFTSENSAKG